MKTCPQCGRKYIDDSLNFCLEDGSHLSPADYEGDPTAIIDVSRSELSKNSAAITPPAIRYCTTEDGVRIAYSVIGQGPAIVRVLGHFTHLEMESQWPDLWHYWEKLSENFTVIRYDGRGIGLSEKYSGEFTEQTRQLELDAVLDAVGVQKATLLGISEGGWTSALYANQHPDRVERLILYGSYCHGAQVRAGYDPEESEALFTLIRKGWGRDTPAFRQVFTSQFFRPGADPKLLNHFNEMQRVSADADTAASYLRSLERRGNGEDIFKQLSIPTLVLQSGEDLAVDPSEARLLASIIPGARLVIVSGNSHYFPTDRQAVDRIVSAISQFTNDTST